MRRREGREAGRRRPLITEAEFLARRESVDRVMVVRERDGRTQIGVLEDGVLVEHYVARRTQTSMVGNVYLGRVQNVLPSMEAAFVDIGKGRNAVLYAGEVNWDAAGHGGAAEAHRARPEGRGVRAGPGHQGPDRAQGRQAHEPGLPARALPRVRPRRLDDRDLPQAAGHGAGAPEEGAAGRRPRQRRRHRAHGRGGRRRGGAGARRRPAAGAVGGHLPQGRRRQRPGAAVRRARSGDPGRPRHLQRGLRQARDLRGRRVGHPAVVHRARRTRPGRAARALGGGRRRLRRAPDRRAARQGAGPQGLPALGRVARHRPHRGHDGRRRQHRQVHRARAATSRRRSPATTSRPPRRSSASSGCATSAGSSSSTSSTWCWRATATS